jgi:hypothetical protein
MVQVQQRILTAAALICAIGVAPALAVRFYPDDPLIDSPKPRRVEKAKKRKLSDMYDLFSHSLIEHGERSTSQKAIPAEGVNTLGEVMNGPWYTNRHYFKAMSIEELQRGPGIGHPPESKGPWTVTAAKNQGITPGFRIKDARGVRYVLKFDPLTNPEMATAADVIGSRFFHALGYNVPEYYVVNFRREQLIIDPKAKIPSRTGEPRPMNSRDLDEILMRVPRRLDGSYRAVASLFLDGEDIGEFRFYGTRADDPNDITPHEHRRDLRGLFVFCAWLAHDDSRAVNTLDMIVEENGNRFIKHYLIDFGSTLGSASTKANSARSGNEHLFAWTPAMKEFLSLGLYVPEWTRVKFPNLPSVGRLHYVNFDPEAYKTEYPNPAFENRHPDDTFWAARQVMSFSNDQIAAIVKTGDYTNPAAEEWVIKCLIERRDRIGRAYFSKVLPLDRFNVRNGTLEFVDLAVHHGLAQPRQFKVEWSEFDNQSERHTSVNGSGFAVPRSSAAFLSALIKGDESSKSVRVYLRSRSGDWEVVGIERTW